MYEQVRDAVVQAVQAAGGEASYDQVLAAVPREGMPRLGDYLLQMQHEGAIVAEARSHVLEGHAKLVFALPGRGDNR